MKKPKRKDSRNHRHKNFSYLIKKKKPNKKIDKDTKGNKKKMNRSHTVHDINGKSIIRNMDEVFRPLVFADFNYLLTGKQSLTDIDGQLEINGNIFIVESKTHYSSINGGQLVSLFHNAYNTWRSGKIGQLTYRIATGKRNELGEELFDYVIYGTQQFKHYEAGLEVTPHYELDRTNEWLAKRLKAFQEVCTRNHDKEIQIKNRNLFGSIGRIHRHLHTRGADVPF